MTPILQHYLTEFEKLSQSSDKQDNLTRQTALERFLDAGFPTVKNESFRYMARAGVLQQPFTIKAPTETPTAEHSPDTTTSAVLHLVFVDGYFAPQLSSAPQSYPPGITVQSIRQQSAQSLDTLVPQTKAEQPNAHNSFTELNAAFYQDGIIVQVEDHCVLTQPIALWFIQNATSEPRLIPMRNTFKIGQHSQVHFIERYAPTQTNTAASASHFTNVVSTVDIAPHAQVTWSQAVTLGEQDCHTEQLNVTQHHNSHFQAESVVLGGGLVRNTVPVYLTGEGATCKANGLSMAKNRHHIDHSLAIYHQASHTHSDVHYRAIADDRSRVTFSGGVYVVEGIAKIEANQHNHNLLLSPAAEIDTQPKLELFSDDIMCTHGATVGEIDEKALFYLQARGLPEAEARFMLMDAFGKAILQQMTIGQDEKLNQQLTDFTKTES